jgi:hypothetical protein
MNSLLKSEAVRAASCVPGNPPFSVSGWGGEHLGRACCARGAGKEDRCQTLGMLPVSNANVARLL